MKFSSFLPTVEMPVWTDDGDAPAVSMPTMDWGVYTELGPFKPQPSYRIPVPHPVRVHYRPDHAARPRKGQFGKWARSMAREVGEFFVGAFQPIREAA